METEREEKKENKRVFYVPVGSIVLLSLGLLGALIHIFSVSFPSFADFINETIGHFLRFTLSKAFSILPFSFMELLLFFSPILIAVAGIIVYKKGKKGRIYLIRAISTLLAIAALIYFLFAASFAPGYRGEPLGKKLGFAQNEITKEELYDTACIIRNELNSLADDVIFFESGASRLPFSYDTLSEKLCDSYEIVEKEYAYLNTFDSSVKSLIISPLMTYTHLTGIYSFFTGEANINTNFPDFIIVHSAAHEMAHQRGISREDEANFTSFLVCREADDPYIRYCAYLNMFLYFSNALYSADPALHAAIYDGLDERAHGDLIAYSLFFEKYEDSAAGEIAESLNNAYLESQGTQGTASYGLVVDLTVAFYADGNTDLN